MTYKLEFNIDALKEWNKIDSSVREQFKKQLARRLEHPHIPSARLSGADMHCTYKIKLRDIGYRLIDEVNDMTVTVIVLVVGKRNRSEVYDVAKSRK